jgi:multiple sugar transport system substrate-binding protein
MDAFSADLPYTKGKNVKAAFYNKQNYPKNPTEYDGTALSIAYNRSLDLYAGKDINTVIRETEEEINKEVEKLKSGKK